ncbi:nucleotidyltransferase family protein [Shewanella sp. SG41-4]|uniref:nucleotidyltransferase family protein n=1 Tax=Shewanella sp. SG41-4 TaxID=2760976 RepID=UPI0016003907|nr:nucleotidyltransferase family protein [Shewanella sp. SG41-4]MBB1440630.1 nucleotidyltransferase family protein [Shewanella sp. SG41-4]
MTPSDESLLRTFLCLCNSKTPVSVLKLALLNFSNEEQLKWLIERHRVWNLAAAAVKKLDADYFSADFRLWIKSAEVDCKQKTLQQFKVQSELSKQLNDVEVNYHFFKGIDLSLRLYGDLNCRFSKDIDLLISEQDAIKAEQVLLKYGYKSINDAFTDIVPSSVIRGGFYKDKCYQARYLPVMELHTRVNNENTQFSKAVTASLLDGVVGVSIIEYLYLCVHAMKSNCHRVKWLIDLAFYYEKLNQHIPDWDKLKWAEAHKFGITRQVIACEYLMAKYLDIAVTPKGFIGLISYCNWISDSWLREYRPITSIKWVTFPLLMNSKFEHRRKAFYLLLFCPNERDKAFIDHYAKSDGRYIKLLIPFRKFFRYTKNKWFRLNNER